MCFKGIISERDLRLACEPLNESIRAHERGDGNVSMLIKEMTIMNLSLPFSSLAPSLSLSFSVFLSVSFLPLTVSSSLHSYLPPFSFSPPPPPSRLRQKRNERLNILFFPLAIGRPDRIITPDFLPSDRAPISEIRAAGEGFCRISKRFFII